SMTSGSTTVTASTRLVRTDIPQSWAWMRPDLLVRIGPFAAVCAIAYLLASRPGWFGLSAGRPGVQLVFAAVAAPLLFLAAMAVQLLLTRRRGVLSVPASARDAWFQAGYYAVNGPIEEAFFRGF